MGVYREDILGDEEDVDGVAADLRHAKEYVEQPSDEHRLGRIMIDWDDDDGAAEDDGVDD